MRYLSLGAVLYLFWLVLSGHYTPRLLAFGVLSVIFALVLAARMRSVDEEGHPIQLAVSAVTYLPWLIWEIVKAAWSVAKIILDPKLPVSPAMITLKPTQKTPVGVNVYANSITLTPGTITVKASNDVLEVHALTREGADDLLAGGMDARVSQFEGSRT